MTGNQSDWVTFCLKKAVLKIKISTKKRYQQKREKTTIFDYEQ